MNNKPVAWIGETLMGRQYINGQKGILPIGTPLYISPTCPTKTLTDEEIIKTCIKFGFYDRISDPYTKDDGNYSLDGDLIDFARAILRKAQEK